MKFQRWFACLLVLALSVSACIPIIPTAQVATSAPVEATATSAPQEPVATIVPTAAPTQAEANPAAGDPFAAISTDSLMEFTRELSSIQPYSGWRNSASSGEAEAIEAVAAHLDSYSYLVELGQELERQEFNVLTGTEFGQQSLELTIGGQPVQVNAEAIRGHRDNVLMALRADSDGQLNDSEPNPVQGSGVARIVTSEEQLNALTPSDTIGNVLFVDYALVDRNGPFRANAPTNAQALVSLQPACLVLVTKNSDVPGESHGTFVGDNSPLASLNPQLPRVPVLFFRIEELTGQGINAMTDLTKIESASFSWDVDVFAPGTSHNLVARIPGRDSSKAVILGAHIDSPNSPGALDDGSGSVTLLEVARVLNETQTQPPLDLYLVWFGSEELGLWGSAHFTATHQELLDRTVAMLTVDDLTNPIEGIDAYLGVNTWSFGRVGGPNESPWGEYLADMVSLHGVEMESEVAYSKYSDNNNFDGYNVPNAQLMYANEAQMQRFGGPWPAGRIHDPYDTAEQVEPVLEEFRQMVVIALTAALEPPTDLTELRVAPAPEHRVVVAANHTEPPHMTPAEMGEFGMSLAMSGFDVDQIAYGQTLTAADLEGADMVIVTPLIDLPSPDGDMAVYDDGWKPEEVEALKAYVDGGGLLVITNSLKRTKHALISWEPNEDALEMNELSQQFGVTFTEGVGPGGAVTLSDEHPLTQGVPLLQTAEENAVPFSMEGGQVLAGNENGSLIGWLNSGTGEVLVLGDISLFSSDYGNPNNLPFWRNLAEYAAGAINTSRNHPAAENQPPDDLMNRARREEVKFVDSV